MWSVATIYTAKRDTTTYHRTPHVGGFGGRFLYIKEILVFDEYSPPISSYTFLHLLGFASSLAPRPKGTQRYRGVGSMPAGHYLVVMRAMSPL